MESEANAMRFELPEGGRPKKKTEPKSSDKTMVLAIKDFIKHHTSACEKIDKLFGSGGEAIIHYMAFEFGYSSFAEKTNCNLNRSADQLLAHFVDLHAKLGWGYVSMRIVSRDPPIAHITVRDPAVKTLQGSQKHLIGSFWAGILSNYFRRQLICKDFDYSSNKNELSYTITIQ